MFFKSRGSKFSLKCPSQLHTSLIQNVSSKKMPFTMTQHPNRSTAPLLCELFTCAPNAICCVSQ